MAIVNMKDMLYYAYKNKFAVGAFDIVDLSALETAIHAAQDCNAPVILNVSASHSDAIQLAAVTAAAETTAQQAMVPVAIHYNQGHSFESAVRAVNAGCNSIMISAADQSFDENIALTKKVAEMAAACGVPIEGHLTPTMDLSLSDVEKYVQKTQVDFLCLSDAADTNPTLDWEKIDRINTKTKIPLCISLTKAFDESMTDTALHSGVAKLNFEDDKDIKHCLNTTGSAGRAAEILKHCQAWLAVEHLIIYNVTGISEDETREMMEKGKQQLSTIPGVRRVDIGRAIKSDASYQYTWLVRFCHPKVIDSYCEHPVHVAFADQLFRPVAGDRISIDYQIL